MVRDDGPRQRVAQPDQIAPADGVLEAREGRLRAERRPGQRLAVEHQLVQRVVGEPGGVVAIEIARGQAKDPLPDQVQQRVRDLARLPRIRQARGHGLRQPQPLVHGLEQHQARRPSWRGARRTARRSAREDPGIGRSAGLYSL